jgi:hypothetical protein
MMTPASVAGLSDLPPHLLAQGAAARSLTGQVGGALSVGILGAIVAIGAGSHPTPGQAQAADNSAFAVVAGAVLVALMLACRLPKRKRSSDPATGGMPFRRDTTEQDLFLPTELPVELDAGSLMSRGDDAAQP